MLKVAFAVYRRWSYEIALEIENYSEQRQDFVVSSIITTPNNECVFDDKVTNQLEINVLAPNAADDIYDLCKRKNIDIIFFYGWSWLVGDKLLDSFLCICLHPSPLPKYRGGSPLQHQILAAEPSSAVSLFQMGKGLDDGPIYTQIPFSLLGDIKDVYRRMTDLGVQATKQLIVDYLMGRAVFRKQNGLDECPPYKRRRPAESELTWSELGNMDFARLNNKVRCLTDPYPNAFIYLPEQILHILQVEEYPSLMPGALVLSEKTEIKNENKKNIFLNLKSGCARIVRYRLAKRQPYD